MSAITQSQFEFVAEELRAGRPIKEAAIAHVLSERTVRRIREAGTWERWPYMQAKAQHGYMTPEYRAALKAQGLPLSPPAKPTISNVSVGLAPAKKTAKKPSLMARLFGWH